ncbi:inositol-3-phosphate synthase [Aggregatilinea lenta]|uniref:inositol-3-phosphate synthase n=1 Tax=Aggregatilinea lenta TaxID=913108 RepID=UPI000E5B4607|nr:inositol-3-phosphate synthase [Aggregatilinea lenta]
MSDHKVRVAIIGVGNCANSLVQGVHFYQNAAEDEQIPGLMHVNLGGYHIRDVEFSAAFDIDADKVGKDLSEAIWSGQNNTIKFTDVPFMGVPVHRGMTHDGLGKYLKQKITKAPGPTADIVQILKDTKTDIVVNYLPVGSEQATKWYVEQVLNAGCAFVNAIPVFIAREPYWQNRFAERGLPMIGDDIKSQVGATILHRVLANLFNDRGVKLERTSQLNVGGNMDFYNMLERERLESKKISKTNAVTSQLPYEVDPNNVYIGPSDYVPWLLDRKWAHIRLEGTTFGNVPLNIELKLEVWDSPNSAGVIIDAVRCAKIGLDRGLCGTLEAPASYFMKSPPVQHPDDVARNNVEAFIHGDYNETVRPPAGYSGHDKPSVPTSDEE